jgi:hypothetical protein
MATGGRPVGVILEIDPRVSLTGRILGVTMSYRLHPLLLNIKRLAESTPSAGSGQA